MANKICIRCYSDFIPRNGNCDLCIYCKKPNKCIHGTSKGRCKIDGCFGSEICKHKQHNQKCSICKPGIKELDKLNSIIRKIITKLSLNNYEYDSKNFIRLHKKTKNFIINLWQLNNFIEVINICLQFIYSYKLLHKKDFNIKYYHIDHIIPKSKFNLTNKHEFYTF